MTRYCSLPQFGNIRKWFEKNFHKPCEYHDKLYSEAKISRWEADVLLVEYMISEIRNKSIESKFFIYYPIITLTFLGVRTIGWFYYNWWA